MTVIMFSDSCKTCEREVSQKGDDIIYADGGIIQVIHGGGQCRECYLKSGHWACECGGLGTDSMKFCSQCGKARPRKI